MAKREIALRRALSDVRRLEEGSTARQLILRTLDRLDRGEVTPEHAEAVAKLGMAQAASMVAELKLASWAHEVRTEATLLADENIIDAEPRE